MYVRVGYAAKVSSGYYFPMRLSRPGYSSYPDRVRLAARFSSWNREMRRVGLIGFAFLGCATATATRPPITPEMVPSLAEGEGLVIIDIDTDVAIRRLAANGGIAAENLAKGQHTWIVRAPAGAYRWKHFEVGFESGRAVRRFLDSDDEEFEFDVVAGVLNYPGELIIRSDVMRRSSGHGIWVRNRNHSAMAVRALGKTHALVVDSFPLRYSGSSKDGFLAHYSKERLSSPSDRSETPPPISIAAPNSGESAERLLSSDGIHFVGVSPSGRWAIAHVQNHRRHGVMIQRLGSTEIKTAISTESPLVSLLWVGPERFLASFATRHGLRSMVGRIWETGGVVLIDRVWIDAPGNLVEPLPLDGDRVLWAFEDGGRSSVNRVDIDDLSGLKERNSGSYDVTTTGVMLAFIRSTNVRWIVDRKGVPRAALRRDEDGYTVLARAASVGKLREIYQFLDTDEEREVWPQSLSADGEKLIVAAYGGHNTLGIVEFDMRTGDLGETLFRRDDVDVSDVVFDFITGELIAAVYEEGGARRFHYFDSATSKQLDELEGLVSRELVHVVSGSADRKVLVLYVSGATNPGFFYLYDTRTGDSNAIGQRLSRVDRGQLRETQTLRVESKDGTPIEAFLTMPDLSLLEGAEGVPLVVFPHGGPIGVRDSKQFDPVVQYLASWGFALLQVNYRGSSGYGLHFEDAGKRQWAQDIEDDIDAAVELVMARSDIDESRVCIVGGSYGGFSSLASILRHKTRYRCAATLNGVTDIPLMFDTSDFADSDDVLERFTEVAGDLETDREKLIELSPVYHVSEFQVPIFVAYGTEDRRVDPDHAHRLLLMLETHGKAHRSLEIRGAAHSPSQREWVIWLRALRRFLTENLYAPGEFVPDPQLESPGFDILWEVER